MSKINIVLIFSLNILIIIITSIRRKFLKKLIIIFLLSSFIKADTATVDERMWSWGVIFPWEFTYIKQSDGERGYTVPLYGGGGYIGYEDTELQFDMKQIDFHSNSLENYDKYVGYSLNTALLYALNRRIQLGAYLNKLSFTSMTKSSDYEKGELIGYGLKMVYNPNRLIRYNEKRSGKLHYSFSLGYVDGKEITSYKTNYQYINGYMQNVKSLTHPDVSGYSASIGVIVKY